MYKLDYAEPLAISFRRIAEEQASIALQRLQRQDVYEARKTLKRMRAMLRLLQPQLGPLAIEEEHRLRDVARRFGSLRDADVSLEVLDSFSGAYKRKSTLDPQRKALTAKQAILKQQSDWPASLSAALEIIAATQRRIEDWHLNDLDQGSLSSQLKKTHKQGLKAFKHVEQTRTVEDFHELRKCVKRQLNQLKLLDTEPDTVTHLKQLSSLLGDHHNLAVLMANLETTSARFRTLVRRQQKLQESEILVLASRVYEASHI